MKKGYEKFFVIALVVIAVAVIAFAFYSKSNPLNAPPLSQGKAQCAMGPLTDCINGCWETYNDRVKDIMDAYELQKKNCCNDASPFCKWKDYGGIGICGSALDEKQACANKGFLSCVDKFALGALIDEAKAKRDACIADCQKTNCAQN